MIEQLRPLQGYKNPDLIPAVELLREIYEHFNNTITIAHARDITQRYGKSFEALDFLQYEGIISTSQYGEQPHSLRDTVYLEIRQYSQGFDDNLIENAKIILRGLGSVPDAYELYSTLITRYDAQDLPYIIDLYIFEDVIKGVKY